MYPLDGNFTDARQEFATRFHQIAQAKGLELNVDPFVFGPAETSPGKLISQPAYAIQPTDRFTLIVPGLLGNSLRTIVAPLLCAKERLTVEGYKLKVAWVSGRSGCDSNARKLREHVLQMADLSGQAVNIIGYSKGCADAMHMLGNHDDTHHAVSSLVSYAGVVSGTPLANAVPDWLNILIRYLPLPGEAYGDGLAISDLSQTRRRQWLLDHPFPAGVRLASITASPAPEMVSRILKSSYRELAQQDADNDSQVISRDALIPDSELLAVVNADHWAIALPIAERHKLLARLIVDKNEFPRDVLIQATIDHLACTQTESHS